MPAFAGMKNPLVCSMHAKAHLGLPSDLGIGF